MGTLFSTMSKINKLEHITREAASSSSDSSTSSLGSLMTAAALNPWIQEARYLIEQQRAAAVASTSNEQPGPARTEDAARRSPTKPAQPMAAIFPGHSSDGRDPRNFVDYSSPQPVFLAPLAGFAQPPRARSQSPDGGGHRPQMAPVLPLNMSMLRSPPGGQREQASPVYPVTSTAIFLGKPTPFITTAQINAAQNNHREEIEERMAAEEEADAKDAANREHAAYIEEALRQHSEGKGASNNGGNCSGSSRSSSIMGNYTRESLYCHFLSLATSCSDRKLSLKNLSVL